MASNAQVGTSDAYQEWLDKGNDLAWSGDWRGAITAYRRALELRDDDSLTYLALGLALYETGELRQALQAYQQALHLDPDDVAALQKIAAIHSHFGEKLQAASTYLALGDRLMEQRQPVEAVRAWQQVVRHDPQNRTAYRRLAAAYRRGHRNDLAAQALLAHARATVEIGDEEEAILLAQEALSLQPDMISAQQLLNRLAPEVAQRSARGTSQLRRGSGMLRDRTTDSLGTGPLDYEMLHDVPSEGDELITKAKAGAGPIEAARQRALARIAEGFFDGEAVDLSLEAMKAQAVDLQSRGLVDEATQLFEQIIDAGGGSSDVYYAQGALYQMLFRFPEAIGMFERAAEAPEYAMAAHYAIGQCYQSEGRMDEAGQSFLSAIKAVELKRVEREEVDSIIRVYEGVIDAYEAQGDHSQMDHFTTELIEYLVRQGWDDKVYEVRARLGDSAQDSESDLLDATDSSTIMAAMQAAHRYRQQGRIRAAIEELYWALTLAPHYLPMHLLMADLYLDDGRPEDAVAKLVAVAQLYEVRGSPMQATQALKQALRSAPTEQNVRSHLIDLLTSHGEIDEALEHYLHLADNFYQLAQGERAIEKLNEALRLAPRGDLERGWTVKIQRRLADIHLQRLDWRRAAAAYEGIHEARPDDLEAVQRLADLYFKLGAEERALATLEDAASQLLESGGTLEMVRFLQQLTETNPERVALLTFTGEKQAEVGDVEGAAQTWERAVEVMMAQKERTRAAGLLRRIVGLHSSQEKRYRSMLKYLMKE